MYKHLITVGLALIAICSANATAKQPTRPNIVWIVTDDMGPELGCYGTRGMRTPNIDRLAAEGALFKNCFTTAPVCSPSRSAMMTGMYQTAINAHHHRSSTDLPPGVRPMTDLFREAGYHTAIVKQAGEMKFGGKTDLNFRHGELFDGEKFSELKAKQPFFARFEIHEPHRGSWKRGQEPPFAVDPATVELPPYYPDTPLARKDWAGYLGAINSLDTKVGSILEMLEKDGLADNTIVFFLADNGRCHVRDKQWLYEGGLHIPLIVRWPGGKLKPGTVRDDLVSAIDISATSLHLAGVDLPKTMQGQVFLGPKAKKREFIFGARDRCDETEDRIRSIRDERYKLIVNFMPERPYTQKNAYKERAYPVLREMKELHEQGKLTPAQARFMAPMKPAEELYDLKNDPHELNNLADSRKHQTIKKELRRELDRWMKECDDRPEKKGGPRT